jgi:O-succinylbenzoate synthase
MEGFSSCGRAVVEILEPIPSTYITLTADRKWTIDQARGFVATVFSGSRRKRVEITSLTYSTGTWSGKTGEGWV